MPVDHAPFAIDEFIRSCRKAHARWSIVISRAHAHVANHAGDAEAEPRARGCDGGEREGSREPQRSPPSHRNAHHLTLALPNDQGQKVGSGLSL